MKYSELFGIECIVCTQRSYDWAIKPPLWDSDKCWNHLRSYEKNEWKDRLLNFLHSNGSLRRSQDEFQFFKENYMETDRPRNLLKKYGYDKYLMEHLGASCFAELEQALQRRLIDKPNIEFFENTKKAHKLTAAQSIIATLRKDCLEHTAHPRFISLQGVDLSGEDLSRFRLDFIVFDGGNLSNVKLTSCDLSNSIFSSIDIRNARLDESEISSCSFKEADLTGASLVNTHGKGVDFRGTELTDVDFTNARLRYSDFSNCILRRCSLQGAQMLGANLTNTKFIETQFHDVNCPDGTFINTDLSNTDLRDSNFSRTDFTNCNLENSLLSGSDMEGANVTHANLNSADLRNASLSKVDLYKADLKATKVYFEDIQSSSILTNQLRDGSLVIERTNKIKVFISYSHNDAEFAKRLEYSLREKSVDVWIDSQEILLGDSLIEKVREGIDKSQYVCALISSTSIESRWVQSELDIAMNQQIEGGKVKVLPLMLEENLPLPFFLVGKLYVDFSKPEYFENGISQIARRLDAH